MNFQAIFKKNLFKTYKAVWHCTLQCVSVTTQVSSPKKCSAVSLIAFIHPRESNSTFFSVGRSAKFDETKRDFLVLYVNTCYNRWEEIFLLVSCGQTTLIGGAHGCLPAGSCLKPTHLLAIDIKLTTLVKLDLFQESLKLEDEALVDLTWQTYFSILDSLRNTNTIKYSFNLL